MNACVLCVLRVSHAFRACVLLVMTLAMSACSTPPQQPQQTLPPPNHAYQVAQLERPDGNAAYVTCSDCPAPTRKTLPGAGKPPAVQAPRIAQQQPPPPKTPMPPAPRSFTSLVQFDLNSAKLTAQARAQIDAWAAVLRLSTRLQVAGFTDDLGGPRLNAKLSEARGVAVLSALRERLDVGRTAPAMTSTGRPLCCYITDNRGEANRKANRRAVVQITVPDGPDLDRALRGLAANAALHEVGSRPAAAAGDSHTHSIKP